jgi:hypothetical protein
MRREPSSEPAIIEIAGKLGLAGAINPSSAIIEGCQMKAAAFMAEYGGCENSEELLAICAQKLGTRFVVIETLEGLDAFVRASLSRKEIHFATVESEFERGVLGITFRLRHPHAWESPFVSVIDARGERRHRAWFTKWHELGHLFILGSSSRSSFCRTHTPDLMRDPEEALVDRIAGACAFHPALVRPLAEGALSFQKLDIVRNRLCPEASIQSSEIGILQAWPTPCILVECRWAGRRGHTAGTEMLRAVKVVRNDAAWQSGLAIHTNMRVPERSVIYQSFAANAVVNGAEDLSWWASSTGAALASRNVSVSARSASGIVIALVCTDALAGELSGA